MVSRPDFLPYFFKSRHWLQFKGDVPKAGHLGGAPQPVLGAPVACLCTTAGKVHRPAQYHAIHGLSSLRLPPPADLSQVDGDQLLQFVVATKDRRPLVAAGQLALEGM